MTVLLRVFVEMWGEDLLRSSDPLYAATFGHLWILANDAPVDRPPSTGDEEQING